jgi:hypothetical protein
METAGGLQLETAMLASLVLEWSAGQMFAGAPNDTPSAFVLPRSRRLATTP